MAYRVGQATIELVEGDITRVTADAIVNAANESLIGGGGVDGAIHRAGGPEIMQDLERRYGRDRRCPTGDAVLTTAGRLPARHVVHAVGPRWRDGRHDEPELLASAYRRSLEVAAEAGATSVALPSISTGIYGFPVAQAAPIAIAAVRDHLAGAATPIRRAVFVLRGADTMAAFRSAAERLLGQPPSDGSVGIR